MTSGSARFTKKKPSVDQLFVLIAHQLDVVMGVPLPGVVKKAIDILTAKTEAHDGGAEN